MFFHTKMLQYNAKPDRPDPVYAKKLQEVLGGQWGEITVMLQYLFQGWNCRGPAKYRDMLLDIGTEEIAHVEMLATMICRLLEGASQDDQQDAAKSSGVVSARSLRSRSGLSQAATGWRWRPVVATISAQPLRISRPSPAPSVQPAAAVAGEVVPIRSGTQAPRATIGVSRAGRTKYPAALR